MKRLTIYCLAILSMSLSANAQVISAKNPSSEAAASMKGAFLLTMQKGRQDNKDTMMDIKQLKIYTDHYFMYAHPLPGDTSGNFGIGTYTIQNGKLTEHSFYTSDGGVQDNKFEVNIAKSPGGYSQVINFPPDAHGSIFVLTETYKDVSTNAASALDGAWKMTATTSYSKDGKATVTNKPLQYKVYQSGHFIFGGTQTDPATKKTVANIGYGTYIVGGENEITETPMNSSYKDIIDVSVKLKLTFKGKDHYQQTILWTDGSKLVEEYERLK
jgi:hypothetical protein